MAKVGKQKGMSRASVKIDRDTYLLARQLETAGKLVSGQALMVAAALSGRSSVAREGDRRNGRPTYSGLGGGGGSVSGGSVLWTPLNLGSALVAWWDASYLPNLTFNGSSVSAWTDRSANAITASTGASQPGWSATARNGKPGVVFTASNSQRLSFTPTGFPTGTSPVSGLVAAFGNGAQNGGEAIAFGTPAVNQVFRIITSASSVAQYTNAGLTLSGTTWTNVDSTTVATIAGGTSPTANLYQNGVFAASGTAPTQNLSNFEGKIGSIEDGSSGYWNGTIQQIVIGNVAFSTCQRQKLEGWESWYDGKAGANLPSDHPYKNTPPVVDGTC